MRSSIQRQQGRISRYAGSVLLGATLLSPATLWAAVSAHLDRDVIHQGDSVNLTIESDRTGQTTAPDWTPLQQDFVVLATQRGSLTQIINGRRNDKITWSAELEPRKSGSLEVPSIKVGAETTAALALRVAPPPPAASAAAGDPVFVTVAVEPKDEAVRVQQQLHYKVRLYSKHPIVDGVLSDPQPVDAVVEQLGEDRKGSARVGGQTFQVIERDYAIFPEKSGALEIPPVTFRGHVSDPNRQRSMNDPFQRMDSMMNGFFREPFLDQFFQRSPLAGSLFARGGTKVRVHSEATSVTVEPRPAGYGGSYWLPAEEVVLHDSWADGVPTLRAGEPLSRTITLEAKGAAASQLPELVVPAVKGLRVYPERSERDNVTDGQRVHGRLAQSFTFMPTEEGDVTLPEIRLSWWDTNANVERVAILPEIATHVLPGTGATYNPAVGDAPPTGAETRPNETAPVPALNVAPRWYDSLSIWVSGLLVVALLAVVLAWRRNHMRRGNSAHESAPDRPTLDGNTARARLEQACRSNNAYAAAMALLTWATATWPQRPPQNLTELAARVAVGGEAIEALNRALYAPDSDKWAGTALWEALRGGLREHNESKAAKQKGLPPLYPQAV